jgi:hypothetical protein
MIKTAGRLSSAARRLGLRLRGSSQMAKNSRANSASTHLAGRAAAMKESRATPRVVHADDAVALLDVGKTRRSSGSQRCNCRFAGAQSAHFVDAGLHQAVARDVALVVELQSRRGTACRQFVRLTDDPQRRAIERKAEPAHFAAAPLPPVASPAHRVRQGLRQATAGPEQQRHQRGFHRACASSNCITSVQPLLKPAWQYAR